MIDLLRCFHHRSHSIRLNTQFRRELQWWISFSQDWNGISFFVSPAITPLVDLSILSDASVCGAICANQWFFLSWSVLSYPMPIAFLELVPIIVTAHLWGASWCHLRVQFLCDNAAVVAVLDSSTSPWCTCPGHSRASHASRALFFFCHLCPRSAELRRWRLSRLNLQELCRLAPHVDPKPQRIPESLLRLLVLLWLPSVATFWRKDSRLLRIVCIQQTTYLLRPWEITSQQLAAAHYPSGVSNSFLWQQYVLGGLLYCFLWVSSGQRVYVYWCLPPFYPSQSGWCYLYWRSLLFTPEVVKVWSFP